MQPCRLEIEPNVTDPISINEKRLNFAYRPDNDVPFFCFCFLNIGSRDFYSLRSAKVLLGYVVMYRAVEFDTIHQITIISVWRKILKLVQFFEQIQKLTEHFVNHDIFGLE